jgi:hypothetical protein
MLRVRASDPCALPKIKDWLHRRTEGEMTVLDRMTGATALAAALFVVAGASAPPAQAAYVVTLAQDGPNVVATGSGTIDLAGLTFLGSLPNVASSISPSGPEIITGAESDIVVDGTITAPMAFGSGGLIFASAGSGDLVGADANALALPLAYVSGGALSGSATFNDATFASLGITPGAARRRDPRTLDLGAVRRRLPRPRRLRASRPR